MPKFKKEKAIKPRKFSSPLAKELIEGLEETLEKLKVGGIASVKYTVLEIPPDVLHPIHIKQIRESLGLSQQLFADFIAASASAVRAWEQGAKTPTPMAKRFMVAMRDDPEYWQAKLKSFTRTKTV
jgi:DNA-binding transcriptional regulator YiaG